jgi:hypothetical protein
LKERENYKVWLNKYWDYNNKDIEMRLKNVWYNSYVNFLHITTLFTIGLFFGLFGYYRIK